MALSKRMITLPETEDGAKELLDISFITRIYQRKIDNMWQVVVECSLGVPSSIMRRSSKEEADILFLNIKNSIYHEIYL